MPLTAPATVGRERELRTLSVAMERARRGQGGAIFLVGEAGIGKSRIAGEVTGRAFGAGMRVLRGRGSLLGATVPFRPIAEALLGMLRAEGAPHHADLVSYQPALGRLVPEWRQPGPSPQPESIVVLAPAVLPGVSLA